MTGETELLFSLIDQMDTLLVVLDPQGEFLHANRACERLLGCTAGALQAALTAPPAAPAAAPITPPTALTSPAAAPPAAPTSPPASPAAAPTAPIRDLQQMQAELRACGHAGYAESQWIAADGAPYAVAWSVSRLTGADGAIRYYFINGAEITRRLQAERSLELERSLLQGLIDSIPDLIFYKGLDQKYLGCNTAFQVFRGAAPGSITGLSDEDLYPPDLAALFHKTDLQVLAQHDASVLYENWTTRPDGQPALIETRKTAFYAPNGQVLGVLGIGRDITHHRMIENDLRTAKLEIEQIIASLSSILVVLSPEQVVTRWNPMAQEIFGLPAWQAIGQPLGKLPIEWEWGLVEAAIRQSVREQAPINPQPARFRRRDGSEGYLGVSLSPVYTRQGLLSGVILLGGDITERKILENRLAQAQKLKSIGQLAAGIAHEINSPIQYIGDNANFLKDSFQQLLALLQQYQAVFQRSAAGLDEEDRAAVWALRRQAGVDYLVSEIPAAIEQSLEGIRRVSEIVRAMKEFSHPGVREKKPCDINKALLTTLAVARNEWKYVAELETDLDPNLPEVLGLPGEINQVFLNILVNAVYAIAQAGREREARSEPHQGRIRVQTRCAGAWAEVRIQDNGAGIPEDVQPHIFEPFFTTKDVGQGSGQGLAIAYDVIERKHGGQLTFESRLGQGATFCIRLPIEAEAPAKGISDE
ncbi:MAG: PAS domain-containing protein [Chloroflexota bacterium]